MNKDRILAVFVLIAISMSTIVGLLTPVTSQLKSTWVGGTIYIRADGRVEPTGAPIITQDNRTYTLVDDIQITSGHGVVIERDDIVLDGNGHTIQGSGALGYSGILLDGRANITIKNLGIMRFARGVSVGESINITIVNNTITYTGHGISLWSSSGNVIETNTIANIDWIGMMLTYSSGSVRGNIIVNTGGGILLGESSGNVIENNTIANAGEFGISLYESSGNVIENNTIANIDWIGILLYSEYGATRGNTIVGNVFIKCGLFVWYSYNNTVVDNTVNGKPLVYLEGASNIEITGEAGQVIVVKSKNIVIKGLNICNTTVGMELFMSQNIYIEYNTIADNRWYGVYLRNSSNSAIVSNTIANTSEYGIRLDYLSSDNIIMGNTIANNWCGIQLDWSSNNAIEHNTITDNWYGIYLLDVSDNTIEYNTITNAGGYGIYLEFSSGNVIKGNTLRNNGVGVGLYCSANNVFLYNNFIDNSIQVALGYGVGYNAWDDGVVGNYWSDHDCVDSDGNGVCDVPYVIRYPDNVDRYPSMYPYPFEVVSVRIDALAVFVRAIGGDVWYGLIGEDGTVEWRSLGGIVADAPSAVFYRDKIYVIARSEDGALWYGTIDPVNWDFSGWMPLQGLAGSRPSVVVTDYGIVVVVRDFNNGIWIGLLNESGVSWVNVPGATVDSPAIAYLGGELHIVVRGLDGYTIWHGVIELPYFIFKGWGQVSGLTNSAPELIAIGDTIYLAVRDLGDGVALAMYSGYVGWLGWISIPGGLTDAQPNLAYFNGELIVAVKALNDQSIWLARKDHYGYWGWVNIPGLTTHEPDLMSIKYACTRVVPKT